MSLSMISNCIVYCYFPILRHIGIRECVLTVHACFDALAYGSEIIFIAPTPSI